MKQLVIDILKGIGIGAVMVAILFCFLSCQSAKPVVVPSVHNQQHDSVRTEYKHDSIYIDRWHTIQTVGDTTYIRDSVYIDRWHKIQLHDSIYFNQTDTIYQTVQVQAPQSVFLRNSGIALWVILALMVLAVVVGIILKFKK